MILYVILMVNGDFVLTYIAAGGVLANGIGAMQLKSEFVKKA